MSKSSKSKRAVWDARIVRRAAWDSVLKLNPRTMMRNPVMFVVEVGSVVTTALLFHISRESFAFNLQITLWLWFTVLFANFAEAVAEGRGRAQADTLRQTRMQTRAKRLLMPDDHELYEGVPAEDLETGDLVVCAAGDVIPGDGEVIEGIASVNEAAITGESAPVSCDSIALTKVWTRSASSGSRSPSAIAYSFAPARARVAASPEVSESSFIATSTAAAHGPPSSSSASTRRS